MAINNRYIQILRKIINELAKNLNNPFKNVMTIQEKLIIWKKNRLTDPIHNPNQLDCLRITQKTSGSCQSGTNRDNTFCKKVTISPG